MTRTLSTCCLCLKSKWFHFRNNQAGWESSSSSSKIRQLILLVKYVTYLSDAASTSAREFSVKIQYNICCNFTYSPTHLKVTRVKSDKNVHKKFQLKALLRNSKGLSSVRFLVVTIIVCNHKHISSRNRCSNTVLIFF